MVLASRKCANCGRPESVDGSLDNAHIIPKSQGGTLTVPLCTRCHRRFHRLKWSDKELRKFGIARREYISWSTDLAKVTVKNGDGFTSKRQTEFYIGAVIALLAFVAIYYLFAWMTPTRWAIVGGSILAVAILYPLIRWRTYILSRLALKIPPKSTVPVSSALVWQPIASAECPLWLAYRLYELRFRRKIQKTTFIINGKVWQYKIDIDPSVPEPSATVSNIRIQKARIR